MQKQLYPMTNLSQIAQLCTKYLILSAFTLRSMKNVQCTIHTLKTAEKIVTMDTLHPQRNGISLPDSVHMHRLKLASASYYS